MTQGSKRVIILPNGDAVDPAAVVAVQYLPRFEGGSGLHSDRVMVRAGEAEVILNYESAEDAIAARDEIVRKIDRARDHQQTREDVRAQLLREAIAKGVRA